MSKIRCVCGAIVEMITVPNPAGFICVTESDLDQFETTAEDQNTNICVFDAINDSGVQGYRCIHCSRLILFEDGRDGEATYYKKESLPEA